MSSRRVIIEKIPALPKKEVLGSRVSELVRIISDCQDEIAILKESCEHEKYDLGYYSWRVGCIDLKRMCSYCRKVIGDPSIEEQETYYKEHGNILSQRLV